MNELQVNYVGEWAWAGELGHIFILVSILAALYSTLSYFMAARLQAGGTLAAAGAELSSESLAWRRSARVGFYIHAAAILGIFVLLFYLIMNHRFEFKYVWSHSSLDLPIYYMISCFWEGQEGSFLLWAFWHAVLGMLLMRWGKKWESPVMTFVALSQLVIMSMLLGLYFGSDIKYGSNPFVLLRNEMMAPIFMRPNYLESITDGTGLNPLLQNYWMVIHPPTLFLGFAAMLIPFAYFMGAMWKRDFSDWVLPTMKWALFAAAILGGGILMGGAWAYESLSFGGFWAWDPVENASLVPWIVLVAAIHTLLAYKNTGRALRITAILMSISYFLVLYSTFLTRTGVLGDTSVHAFTGEDMFGELLAYLAIFFFTPIGLIAYSWNKMPAPENEESAYSREFWLFVGALVLLFVSLIISWDTSLPVVNSLFGTEWAIADPVPHYNRYTIWFAVTIAIMTAVVQFLRYKSSDITQVLKQLAIPLVATIAASIAIGLAFEVKGFSYWLLLGTSAFAIIANLMYLITVLRGKVKVAGASITHIGFGLILLGTLISQGGQKVISLNTLGIDYGEDFDEAAKRENVLLYKNDPIQMGDYWVTYAGDSVSEPNTFYKVKYELKANKEDKAKESFTLYPNAQVNPEMGLIANPDTRHYPSRDIFTHVTSVVDPSRKDETEQLSEMWLSQGDTIVSNGRFLIFNGVNPKPNNPAYFALPDDIAAEASIQILTKQGESYTANPLYYIRDNREENIPAVIEDLSLTINFLKIDPEKGRVQLQMVDRSSGKDFIIMKAVLFPYINVLWLGCFVMVVGFFIAMFQRNAEQKRLAAKRG